MKNDNDKQVTRIMGKAINAVITTDDPRQYATVADYYGLTGKVISSKNVYMQVNKASKQEDVDRALEQLKGYNKGLREITAIPDPPLSRLYSKVNINKVDIYESLKNRGIKAVHSLKIPPTQDVTYFPEMELSKAEEVVNSLIGYKAQVFEALDPKTLAPKFTRKLGPIPGKPIVVVKVKGMLYPSFESSRWTPPYYSSPYYANDYSHGLMKWFRGFLVSGKFKDEESVNTAVKHYESLVQTVSEYYFGTGTPAGQLNRLGIINDNAKLYASTRMPWDRKRYELYLRRIEKMLPHDDKYDLPKLDKIYLPEMLQKTYSEAVEGQLKEKLHPVTFKFNGSANPGPLLGYNKNADGEKLTRNDTSNQDYVIAREMMIDLAEMTPEDFTNKYDWMRLSYSFAKGEVFPINTREGTPTIPAKGRAISIFSSAATVIQSMMTQLPQQCCQVLFSDEEELVRPCTYKRQNGTVGWEYCYGIANMLGINLFNSGMDRFVNEIFSVDGFEENYSYVKIMAFADNLYIAKYGYEEKGGGWMVEYASLDVAKAESSIFDLKVKGAYEALLSRWGGHLPIFDTYIEAVVVPMCVDSVQIMGNKQFSLPCLASGSVLTAFLNQCNSTDAAIAYIESTTDLDVFIDSDQNITEGFAKSNAEQGIAFTFETGWFKYVSPEKEDPGEYLVLDLIGYDAQQYEVLGTKFWFPVLAKDRLYKSISLIKTNYGDPVFDRYLELVKIRADYLTAAWAYPELSRVLQSYAGHLINQIKEDVSGHSQEELRAKLVELSPGLANMADEMKDSILKPELPTLYELIKLNLGVDIAETAIEEEIKKGEIPLQYLYPADQAYRFGDEQVKGKHRVGIKIEEEPIAMGYAAPNTALANKLSQVAKKGPELGTKKYPDPELSATFDQRARELDKERKESRHWTDDVDTTEEKKLHASAFMRRISEHSGPHSIFRVPVPPSNMSDLGNLSDEVGYARNMLKLNMIHLLGNAEFFDFAYKELVDKDVRLVVNPVLAEKVKDGKFDGYSVTSVELEPFMLKPYKLFPRLPTTIRAIHYLEAVPTIGVRTKAVKLLGSELKVQQAIAHKTQDQEDESKLKIMLAQAIKSSGPAKHYGLSQDKDFVENSVKSFIQRLVEEDKYAKTVEAIRDRPLYQPVGEGFKATEMIKQVVWKVPPEALELAEKQAAERREKMNREKRVHKNMPKANLIRGYKTTKSVNRKGPVGPAPRKPVQKAAQKPVEYNFTDPT